MYMYMAICLSSYGLLMFGLLGKQHASPTPLPHISLPKLKAFSVLFLIEIVIAVKRLVLIPLLRL